MTFKNNWEKTDSHTQIDDLVIREIIKKTLPNKSLSSYTVITGGCANLNIQLIFSSDPKPLILRIYLRDPGSAYREKNLSQLVRGSIPVPEYYHVGEVNGYHFALVEFVSGITLRDLILNHPEQNIKNVMIETAQVLGALQSFQFNHSGFFDQDLNIQSPLSKDFLASFLQKCLVSPTVTLILGAEKISRINKITEKYSSLFPDGSHTHLVHADFDPANILVKKSDHHWKIAAVLDWEFAFSGSWYCDVANMLRYSHQVHPDFERYFLQGLNQSGLSLSSDWRITVNLLNLLSLLDCLVHCPPEKRPNQCADICSLLDYIIEYFEAKA